MSDPILVLAHPDTIWEVRKVFASMTPRERARYELRESGLAEPGEGLHDS